MPFLAPLNVEIESWSSLELLVAFASCCRVACAPPLDASSSFGTGYFYLKSPKKNSIILLHRLLSLVNPIFLRAHESTLQN